MMAQTRIKRAISFYLGLKLKRLICQAVRKNPSLVLFFLQCSQWVFGPKDLNL